MKVVVVDILRARSETTTSKVLVWLGLMVRLFEYTEEKPNT